jgi:hypothetical protein
MQTNTNKKRSVESFIVTQRGKTIYAPGTNTHLNASNGQIVLSDGQPGWFATSGALMNKSIITADTAATAPNIALYQGTSASQNTSLMQYSAPLSTRMYERTTTIESRNPIIATKQLYKAGSFSVHVIKNITALSLTTFGLRVAFRGRVAQEFFSSQEAMQLSVQYTTGAYTSGQLATAAPVSDIVNNLVYELLRNSQALNTGFRNRDGSWPEVALALNTAGGAGTLISALAAGTAYSVVTTTGGVRTVTFTAEQVASIQAAATAASLASTTTVEIANSTSPVTADAIMIVAMDRTPAYKDYDPLYKVRLEVGLTYGFNVLSTYSQEVSKAAEAQGSGLQLALKYKFTQGQRKYNLIDVTDPIIEYPNPFDTTDTYDVLSIMHETAAQVDTHNYVISPLVEYICVPTATKGIAGVAAMFTSIANRFDSWLTSAGQPTAQTF